MTTPTRRPAAEITASIRHDEAELAAARREVTLRIMGGNALDEQAVYRVGQRVRVQQGICANSGGIVCKTETRGVDGQLMVTFRCKAGTHKVPSYCLEAVTE